MLCGVVSGVYVAEDNVSNRLGQASGHSRGSC